MSQSPVRIGTRVSQLALWQAHHVADLIREQSPETEVEIVHISTIGDRDRQSSLAGFGGQGVFTQEVQNSLLDGRADIAVHSLKDLPTELVDGLTLGAVPQRASMYDALILPQADSNNANGEDNSVDNALDSLPSDAKIGTGSPRRQAQLLNIKPSLQFCEVRGNVETRLRKLDEGECDAIILAEAGLRRLGLENRISQLLQPPVCFPAVGQGALGLECRADDEAIRELLSSISVPPTLQTVLAERAVLSTLRAGCHAPLGVHSTLVDGQLNLEAVVLSADGQQKLIASERGDLENAVELGQQVAAALLDQGADELIRS